MLRPATPLTVMLVVAFALLLLSVLSTPIISAVPLGSFKDVTFGVFGYCKADGCSSIGIGYSSGDTVDDDNAFDLPNNVRDTLSAILVVHPVAALLTLIMAILAVISHFRAPSHSARYLLLLFIFTLITFLVCLLAFVIDILLFIPHMAWGTYIVLAATILVAMSGVVSCAMRRTVVGRKARQKRIAENAEMSGENFYNREGGSKPQESTHPTVPLVSGGAGPHDNLPAFATFENQKKDDQVSDERIPLTQQSPQSVPNRMASQGSNVGSAVPYNNTPSRSASRDRYGNPINGPPDAYGVARGPSANSSRRGDVPPGGYRGDMPPGGYRGGRGGNYGRGGYDNYGAPMRGRGGYGPPGRGGYPPRGGRGGYGPPPRGGYGPGGMRGGRTPPPGYGNNAGQYDNRGPAEVYGSYDQRPSDPSLPYSSNASTNPSMPSGNGGYEPYNPSAAGALPRAESPPPMPGMERNAAGEAIEMDATPAEAPKGFGQFGQLRDSDVDVAGMVGLQQGRAPDRHDTYMSDGSKYSTDETYVPPRTGWNQGSGRNSPRMPSPLNVQSHQAAAELAGRDTPPVAAASAGNYYEDVDPRFANPSPSNNQPPHQPPQHSPHLHPSHNQPPPHNQPSPVEQLYEDPRPTGDRSRSPAESDRSNFTSISQRGVNPRWNPPPPMPQQYGGAPPRRPVQQQRQDMILDNADFQLPGNSRTSPKRGAGAAGPGLIPGSAYPTGPYQ